MSYEIFKNLIVKKINQDLFLFKYSFKESNFISKKNKVYQTELNREEILKNLKDFREDIKKGMLKDELNKYPLKELKVLGVLK